jgi:hypothetical protein
LLNTLAAGAVWFFWKKTSRKIISYPGSNDQIKLFLFPFFYKIKFKINTSKKPFSSLISALPYLWSDGNFVHRERTFCLQ